MPNLDLAKLAAEFLSNVRPGAAMGMQHWAIRKDAIADSLTTVSQLRSVEARFATARRGTNYGRGTFMSRIGGVAIVPVLGPLVSRMSWSYWSYDEVIRDLNLAIDDDTVTAILLDIDSPGGMVANAEAAAEAIERAAKAKPLSAHVGGIGASAAYWLAAASGDVAAAPTSLVGSVGCLIRYIDIEGIFTRLGARVVEVIAEQTPNKRLDPDSEEGRAELQAIADDGAELFLAGLEQSRGVDRQTLIDQYGEGLIFPAQEALARGMIDRIASFEELLADLADRGNQPQGTVAAAVRSRQETIMADKETGQAQTKAAAAPVTVESLRAEHGDLINQIETEAATAAATAERDRILGIEANALPGHDALVAQLKTDGKTTPAEAAIQILAAERGKAKERESALHAIDKAAEGIASTPSGTGPSGGTVASTPEGWQAEWEASETLQAEYPTVDAYIATMKRDGRAAA